MSNAKEQMTQWLKEQPEDISYDELVREMAFKAMVQKGLAAANENRVISNDELRERIRTWSA